MGRSGPDLLTCKKNEAAGLNPKSEVLGFIRPLDLFPSPQCLLCESVLKFRSDVGGGSILVRAIARSGPLSSIPKEKRASTAALPFLEILLGLGKLLDMVFGPVLEGGTSGGDTGQGMGSSKAGANQISHDAARDGPDGSEPR